MSEITNPAAGVPEFDLADRMRKALRASGTGVQEMADYLEVGRNTVSTWINGRIVPSAQTIRLWALRTGVPYAWLRTGTENPRQAGPDGGARLPRVDSNHQPSD
jgi:transcriptional regulator with XRE-family HTH domain